jgi:alanine racemase
VLAPSTTARTRAWVEIRLDRLRQNAAAAQRAIGPAAALIPMVKADAYGLGMTAVVDALRSFPRATDPWAFGVAAVAEGERLRAHGWQGRILVFSPAPLQEYRRAAEANLTLGVSEVAAVRQLATVAAELGKRLPFHLEIDTGMGRAGLSWAAAAEWGPTVLETASSHLIWEGTYTHFHSADEPDLAPTDEQWRRFNEALTKLPRVEPKPLLHVANSAAILRRSGFGCDLARPGIYLFGGNAGPDVIPEPVASIRARVVLARWVPAGSSVGYGATYRARNSELWGTLGIGYGDGLPRALARGGGEVLVRGQRVPIIGRISMDMTTVDLTGVPAAATGDLATVVGTDGNETITVDEVASRSGTISYEILTGLTSRLPRVYLEGEPGLALPG